MLDDKIKEIKKQVTLVRKIAEMTHDTNSDYYKGKAEAYENCLRIIDDVAKEQTPSKH